MKECKRVREYISCGCKRLYQTVLQGGIVQFFYLFDVQTERPCLLLFVLLCSLLPQHLVEEGKRDIIRQCVVKIVISIASFKTHNSFVCDIVSIDSI